MTGINRDACRRLTALLQDYLHSAVIPDELPGELSECDGLKEIYADMIAMRKTLLAVSKGDLSCRLTSKGFLPGVVKDLQAGLNHLTWQTRMIAQGDFTQRVDFLGEFSESFNDMVAQLHVSMKALNKANRDLVDEIEVRKSAEASLKESEDRFRLLSIIDPLTGLHNRRHFFELAEKETERAARYNSGLSLCVYDVDSFKGINDEHGHDVGDIALRMIADTSRMAARGTDILARYGGEEFILVLPETDLRGAQIIAERIRRAIEAAPLSCAGRTIRVTASFGVAGFDPAAAAGKTHVESLHAMIRRADEALYRAKGAGKNRVVVAS